MNSHPHGEIGETLAQDKKALLIAILITFPIMLVEFLGGIFSNSLALTSDAGHMLTDVLTLGLSLFAVVFIAGQPPTSKRTYGFYRLEILAALINGSLLILISFLIFYEAYVRFLHPGEIKTGLLLIVAAIGLLANIWAAISLFKSSQRGLNVRAALWHVISDALSSTGVLAAGIIIFFTKWYFIDPIISIFIGLVILRGAANLIYESADILLEATPKDVNLEEVIASVKKIEGVIDFHDVHIWTITSGFYALSGHLLLNDRLISNACELLEKVNHLLLDKYRIQHATIQFECQACDVPAVCKIGG